MFNTAVDETEAEIDESRDNRDNKEVDDNGSDDVINNTNVEEGLNRSGIMAERDDANENPHRHADAFRRRDPEVTRHCE